MNNIAISLVGVAALACAGSLQAHHSGYMYDTTPVWVKGRVVRFQGVNPHTMTTLEDRSEDGKVRVWAVEGPPQSALDRRGIGIDAVPKIGDTLEFCAFPYKSPAELERIWPGADFSTRRASAPNDGSSPQYVAGHVMVTPEGHKRLWEPHGMLSECIRSSDEPRQSWLDLLNADSNARRTWCEQRAYKAVQSDASLRQFVEEINNAIDDPCK